MGLLLLGVLCHLLPVMLRHSITGSSEIAMDVASSTILRFSRFCSVMMLIVYVVYIFFQLKTHREIFETEVISSASIISAGKDVVVICKGGRTVLIY